MTAHEVVGAGADRVTAGRGFLKKCCMVLHFVAFCSLLSRLAGYSGTWTSEDTAGGSTDFRQAAIPWSKGVPPRLT